MNYIELTKEKLLTEIDNKSKAIINMGKQLSAISDKVELFDPQRARVYSCFFTTVSFLVTLQSVSITN